MSNIRADRAPIPAASDTQKIRATHWVLREVRTRRPHLDRDTEARDVLQEIGLLPDPHALIRIHGHSRVAANQNRPGS